MAGQTEFLQARASWRNEWKSIVNGGNQCIFF